jgi:hypothetical protein
VTMTAAETYFETHKAEHNFQDGETVYLFIDGIGEVKTTYWRQSHFGLGFLFDEDGGCHGTLKWWLENSKPMNTILAPPLVADHD